jgi:hypothetical protein
MRIKSMRIFLAVVLGMGLSVPIYGQTIKADIAEPAKQDQEFKMRLSGDWFSSSYTFLGARIYDGRIIQPRFVDHNTAFGFFKPASAKWFDYPAKAVRACPLNAGSWGDKSCITSESNSITMPAGTDLNNYRFDFKYEKRGATLEHSFEYRNLSN